MITFFTMSNSACINCYRYLQLRHSWVSVHSCTAGTIKIQIILRKTPEYYKKAMPDSKARHRSFCCYTSPA